MMSYHDLAKSLRGDAQTPHTLTLGFSGYSVRLESSSSSLLESLAHYFDGFTEAPAEPAITLSLIETDALEAPVALAPWPRSPDKAGKEAFVDLADARLIQKIRTGVLFLQGVDRGLGIGPLGKNTNQIINFINIQEMMHWKRNDWEICHAAGLVGKRGAVAFAGFSGGGKSTLMLHLMNAGDYRYLSNDRLLIKQREDGIWARGIAKMPRVNPGTLLNNPTLSHILPKHRRVELTGMATADLWSLEEKYDVPMTEILGPQRIAGLAPLASVVILDWQHDSEQATRLDPVTLRQSPHLLEALMKLPGPFYADRARRFIAPDEVPDPEAYCALLADTPIYCLSGRIDFPRAVALCQPLLSE